MENAQDRATEPWRLIFRPSAAFRISWGLLGVCGIAFAVWWMLRAGQAGTYREVGYLPSFGGLILGVAIRSIYYRIEVSSKGIRTRGIPLPIPRIWTIPFEALESVTVRRGLLGIVVWFRKRDSRWSKDTRGYGTGFYKALAEIRAALPPSIPFYDPDGVFVAGSLKENKEITPASPKGS